MSEINAADRVGSPFIEIHTGAYADAEDEQAQEKEFVRIRDAVTLCSV